MPELLKSVDSWFLIFLVILLGAWFVASVKKIFENFASSINELKDLISTLYNKHSAHESRLAAIEARCATTHGFEHHLGRRSYDPDEPEVNKN